MGKQETAQQKRAEQADPLFRRALDDFRAAESSTTGWRETEHMILTGKRKKNMNSNINAAPAAWIKKPALIGAFSLIFLLTVFAVPFSQTSSIGAHIVFELSTYDSAQQELDFSDILDDPGYGIDNWNTSINLDREDGPLVIDLMLFTEDPGAPAMVLAALTAQNPVLASAEATITPVTESSSGSIFNHLTGELEVSINCEGMSAVEIEAMIRQSLIENGAEGVDVQVIESADGDQRQITISVTADQEAEE